MIAIGYRWLGLAKAINDLTTMRERIARRAAATLRRAQRSAKQAASNALSGPGGELTLSRDKTNASLKYGARPSSTKLVATIVVSGEAINARDYQWAPSPGGVQVKFRQNEPAEDFPGGFQWRNRLWVRQRWRPDFPARTARGNRITRAPSGLVGRLPIKQISGPRPARVVANVGSVRDKIADAAYDVLVPGIKRALRV